MFSELFKSEKIEVISKLPFDKCRVLNERKIQKCFQDEKPLSVIVFAVPYLSHKTFYNKGRNISLYSCVPDYHLYFSLLFDRLISKLKEKFPQNRFAGFGDNSPIDERAAALSCNLGFCGDNGLVINEKYSSFFFIGELICDVDFDKIDIRIPSKSKSECLHCNKCKEVCPMNLSGIECLSALTQKKGELSPFEENVIKKYGSAWGCDLCQLVCPYTEKAVDAGSIFSPIDYFCESEMTCIDRTYIENLSDEEFSKTAFAWRGRATILRNLAIIYSDKTEGN